MHEQVIPSGASAHLVLIGGIDIVSWLFVFAISTVVTNIDTVGAAVEFVLFNATLGAPPFSLLVGLLLINRLIRASKARCCSTEARCYSTSMAWRLLVLPRVEFAVAVGFMFCCGMLIRGLQTSPPVT